MEGPGYRDLFRRIPRSRHMLSRTALGRMLEDEHSSTKSTLSKILPKQNHVCTTADAWSSNNISPHWGDYPLERQRNLKRRFGDLARHWITGGPQMWRFGKDVGRRTQRFQHKRQADHHNYRWGLSVSIQKFEDQTSSTRSQETQRVLWPGQSPLQNYQD